jgi:hypothetical protein
MYGTGLASGIQLKRDKSQNWSCSSESTD